MSRILTTLSRRINLWVLIFPFLVFETSFAYSQSVTAPAVRQYALSTTNQDASGFVLDGFATSDVLLASVGLVNPPSGTTLSISTTTGLTLSVGYSGWTGFTRRSFTGTMANINAALATLKVSTGSATGDVKITVSASVNPDGFFYLPTNGHFYKPMTWPSGTTGGASIYSTIKNSAAATSFRGQAGYLVTITNQDEQDFINANVPGSNILIALTDEATEGVFKWDTGPEAGTTIRNGSTNVSGQYNNWCSGEPNNWGSGEDYVVTKWGGSNCWNDYGPPASNFPTSISGYVIEYGTWSNPDDQSFTDTYSNSVVNGVGCNTRPTIASVANQTVTDGSQTAAINFSQSTTNSGYQWMTFNSVTASTASGTGQNGITVSITQSGGGMGSHSGMYSSNLFPSTYNIPASPTVTIQNTAAGVFTATFSQPVTNPLVAFASVGRPSSAVPVIVSQPFTPIWTYTGTPGWTTTYDLPNNKFTGAEGFNIIRIDGTVTSVSFNYTVSEYYATMAFGFEDQNVSFNWTNSAPSIGLAASGTGNILPFTAVNSGTSPVVATIRATPVSADGCSGTPTTFTITVNPSITAGTLSGTQSVCVGSTSQFSTDGTSGGTWSSSNTAIATVSSSGLVTGVAAGTATITYTIGGSSSTRTITVNAIPTLTSATGARVSTDALVWYLDAANSSSYPGTGTAWNDLSGNGYHATLAGGVTYSSANGGNLNFNASTTARSNAQITTALQNGYTLIQILKLNDFNGAGFQYNANPNFINFWMGGSNKMRWETYAGNAIRSNGALPLNNWVVVGGTFSGVNTAGATGTARIYLNGSLDNTGTLASGPTMPASYMQIGEYAGYMNGAVGATLFYNRQLSATEIEENYNYFAPRYGLPMVTSESNIVACSGQAFTYTPTSNVNGTTFSWSRAAVTGISNAAATGTGAINETLVNTTSSPVVVTYTYTLTANGCSSTSNVNVSVNPTPATIGGPSELCVGTSGTLTNASTGGTWTSSNTSVATVSATGVVTPLTAGTTTITYTLSGVGGCNNLATSRVVTVSAPPTSSGTLSGTQSIFVGATTTLASTVTGGSWTSSNTAVATVNASTGVVTGVAAGTATITYTIVGPGACSTTVLTATRLVTVYNCPTIPALSSSAYPVCAESNFTLTAAGLSGMSSLSSGITFKYSTTALANPYVGGTVIATVPFASLEAGNTIARTTTSLTAGGTYYIYAVLSTTPDGTGCLPYATTTLVVNPKGQVTLPSNIVVCHGASISAQTLTTTNSGGTTTYAWTNSATSIGLAASGSTATIPAFTATNTGSAGVTATIAVTPTYTDGGLSCPGATSSYTVTVNPIPALSSVANQVICNATTGAVNFISTTNPAQNLSVSSGAISVTIPDGNAAGITNALTATIPTGATITGIAVNFNINHTWNSDLIVNLVAPNGQVLNLVNARGGSSDNFTNTTISSSSTTSLATGTAPFTGTFAADAASGVGPTSFLSTAANFAALYSGTTSGSWRLAIRDRFSGDVGTLTSWSITFTYTPVPSVTWTNSNTAIGLAASGTGNISFTATNPGPDQISSTITATPTYDNAGLTCSGTPITFTIAVNPSGQVNAVSNQVLCNTSATSAVTFSTTNNGLISTGGTQTAASGTISVTVPDASAVGATHTIPVSLPTGAVINNMRVTFNMTHTYVGDMVINLKAPNGQVLNLFNQHGGSGDNFVNTVVSSTGTTGFGSGSAPFTGTFAATAAIGQGPTGNVSNAANFAALYSTPNGNWVLAMRDLFLGDIGNLTSWSISFDYTVQGAFGTNMNWTNSNATIGLAATGTGNIPSFTAVNNGGTPIVSTVTVTPSYFNGGTSCAGTPTTFTYTVNPTPTVNAVAGQVFCAGTLSTVNFSGIATGTVYSWTNSNTAIGLAASGTGNLSFTPTNAGTTPIIATITVTPSYTNAGVTCTGTPRTFTITVNPVGQVNAVLSQVLCNGSNTTAVNFATVNGGGTIVAGTPVTANSGTISVVVPDANAAGISSTLPVTLPAGATVTGVSVNFNMNHTWVSDMVFNLKAPNGQILNLVNRRGGAGVNFTNTTISSTGTASLATAAAPFTGTFAADAAIGVGPTGQLSTAANFAGLYTVGSGDWTLQMRDYAGGDVGTLTSWSITINYTTLVPAVTSYAWTNNLSSIGLAASGTGNIASFAATNTTAAPVTATVTVTPTYTNAGTGCAGTPISYTYTVNPTPTVNAVSNQTVCRGSNVAAVTFTGATTGTVYNWTNSNTAIGLAASGTGNIASFVGTNTTAAPISGTITVTPVYTNAGITCTGTPRTFTITVNPIPTVNPVANFAACHNTTAAAAFSGATTGTVFNWTNSNPAIGLPASGSGNISFTALNTTSAPVTATITVTPSFTNGGTTCVGTPTSFVITVNPLPVVTTGTLPGRICISDTLVRLNGTPVGGSWSGYGISGFNFVPPATAVGTWPITYTYANANGCVNSASTTVTVLACEERNRDLDNGAVILYPNPNSGQFNIRVNSALFNVLGMRVYNAAGQLMYVNQWRGLVFARVIPVNLDHLAAGTYMVRLYYGDGMDRGADKTYQVIIAH